MKHTYGYRRVIALVMICVLSALTTLPFAGVGISTADAALDGTLRVKLTEASKLSKLIIKVAGTYSVNGAEYIKQGSSITVSAAGGTLQLAYNGKTVNMGSRFKLMRHTQSNTSNYANCLRFSTPSSLSDKFTGNMEFIYDGGNILTVNHIYIEDYIVGLLNRELDERYSVEALGAQAITARTRARYLMERPANANYDILNSSSHQVFRGIPDSINKTLTAMQRTKGVVIRYNGKLTEALFGASNGGQTELPSNTWGSDPGQYPYYKMVDDPYDFESTKRVYSMSFPADWTSGASVSSKLKSLLLNKVDDAIDSDRYSTSDISILKITNVYPHTAKYPEPSRLYLKMRFVLTVSAKNKSTGEYETVSDVNVDLLNHSDLKDNFDLDHQTKDVEMFSVKTDGTTYTIESRRWGHAVGMSQYGAEVMSAKYGMSATEIVNYYFYNCTMPTELMDDSTTLTTEPDPNATPLPAVTAVPPTTLYDAPLAAKVKLSNTSDTLNVRIGPSTSYAALTSLKSGTAVSVLGATNDWSYIGLDGGNKGYVKSSYLEIGGNATPSPSPSATAKATPTPSPSPSPVPTTAPVTGLYTARVVCSSYLNLRPAASTSGTPIAKLSNGVVVTVLAEEGTWRRVLYNDITGYVIGTYLTKIADVTPAPTVRPTAAPTAVSDYYTAIVKCSTYVNMRSGPSTSYAIVLRLFSGDVVQVRSVSGTWASVTFEGESGYVSLSYLVRTPDVTSAPTVKPTTTSTTKPTAVPTSGPYIPGVTTKGKVTASLLNLRSKADSSANVVTRLTRNTVVDIVGITASGEWYYVKSGSYEGYCSSSYILPYAESSALSYIESPIPNAVIPVYSAPSTDALQIGFVNDGEVFTILERSPNWLRIRTANGIIGYVSSIGQMAE